MHSHEKENPCVIFIMVCCKDIDLIEDVQKFTLKVCLKSWNISYSELLEQANLPTLKARRQEAKLCHLYKIINAETFFPQCPHF